MHKAFFLDRDGTINVDYNFVHKPEEWTWCNGVIDALHWIQKNNFKIIVVTNQSGVARGRYSEQDVQDLHNWVDEQLAEHHLHIDGWYYAPHHPKHDPAENFIPDDRKPNTGMFNKAKRDYNIDFSRSYMAGDKITDLKPAIELGITPFFIRSRHAPSQDKSWLERYEISPFSNLKEVTQHLDNNPGH